jgi:hypothetical protein
VLRIQNSQGQRLPLGTAFTLPRDLSLHEELFEILEKGRADQCWPAFTRGSGCICTEGTATIILKHGSFGSPELIVCVQVISVIALLSSSSWTHSRWVRPVNRFRNPAAEEPEGDDNRANMRRLIEEGIGAEGYHDETSEESPNQALEASSENHEDSPQVVQSSLLDSGNEWRDDGESHRD